MTDINNNAETASPDATIQLCNDATPHPSPNATLQPCNDATLQPSPDATPLHGESERAYEAFRAYLELGPARRYTTVARKVGAGFRTIKRWARNYDWRRRINACAAQSAEHYLMDENAVRREQLLDVARRAEDFRERQYSVATALLDAAEQYLENVNLDDLDAMTFADACKALDVASRISQQIAASQQEDASETPNALRDQLTSLLDQVSIENGVTTPNRT